MQVGDLFFSKSRRSALELERSVLLPGDRHDGLFIDDVKPLANGVIAWQEVQLRKVVERGPREPLVAAPSSLPTLNATDNSATTLNLNEIFGPGSSLLQ